jgi:hypothetical protein
MRLGCTLPLLLVLAAAACSRNETTAPTAAACGYSLASTTQAAPSGGGSFAVTLTATGASCSWSAATDSSWLAIAGAASGSATATLAYTAAANGGASSRTGTITVQWSGGSAQLVVTQAGTSATGGTTCSYTVSPAAQTVTETGGSFVVTVTTSGTGCSWTASSDSSWLAIASGGSGTGSGAIAYSAAPNPDATVRAGAITVQWPDSSAKVTVTESGVAACVYTLSPTTQAVPAAGGSGFTLAVTRNTPNGCSWSATSSVPWITLTGATSGASPGAITYSVDANAGVPRSGVIAVIWSGGSAQLIVNQATATTGPSMFNVSFALFDPGRQSVPGLECQIRSLTGVPTTCVLVATANLPTAMTYTWNVQYPYGFQRIRTQTGTSATFSFTESCGQFSASDGGTQVPLSVQLTVTDAAGNTATVVSGSGGQPPLLITFYSCGL